MIESAGTSASTSAGMSTSMGTSTGTNTTNASVSISTSTSNSARATVSVARVLAPTLMLVLVYHHDLPSWVAMSGQTRERATGRILNQ